ncbi:hypothetical protein BX666DRAFT_1887073 [Dichotomocladium elegans]|nr:hypothetical protein BX666DRAFT_1887073 [Dichotomocladium elegans]
MGARAHGGLFLFFALCAFAALFFYRNGLTVREFGGGKSSNAAPIIDVAPQKTTPHVLLIFRPFFDRQGKKKNVGKWGAVNFTSDPPWLLYKQKGLYGTNDRWFPAR